MAIRNNLAKDKHWLQILHYRKDYFNNIKSDILTQDFFISQEGKINPEKELIENLRIIFDNSPLTKKDKFRCKYPERYNWINNKLQLEKVIDNSTCKDFNKFTKNNSIKSISIIFASGYLSNPASFFGHPLIKFNFDEDKSNELIDTTLNYGAFSPKNENPIMYAFKGLAGFYEAGYTITQFDMTKNVYAETELRDLLEYELKLSPEELRMFVAHLWELQGVSFPYYFVSDNCAFRVAELIELVTNKQLMPQRVPYSIPFSLFDGLNDEKLIHKISYHYSRETRFHETYQNLSPENKKIVKMLIHDNTQIENISYGKLSITEKNSIMSVLFEYYSYSELVSATPEQDKKSKTFFIMERLQYPKSIETPIENGTTTPVHLGQKTFQTQLGIKNVSSQNGVYLRLRPVYYDMLTPEHGHLKNAELLVFDSELELNKSKILLNYLNFISVETLNISATGLPNDGGIAWGIKTGIKKSELLLNNQLTFNIAAGIGKGVNIFKQVDSYCMIDFNTETTITKYNLYLVPKCGILITQNEYFKSKLLFKEYFEIFKKKNYPEIGLENRIGNSRNWDIRISYKHLDESIFQFGISAYW